MKKWEMIGCVVGSIMAIDFVGFMLWAISGQFPADNFFIGGITKYLLASLLF